MLNKNEFERKQYTRGQEAIYRRKGSNIQEERKQVSVVSGMCPRSWWGHGPETKLAI